MQRVAFGNDWFFRDNLAPFLHFVATRAKYDLLPEELQAIQLSVRETDQERERWYDCVFTGDWIVQLSFAINPGSSVVFWRAECPIEAREAIEVAADLMQVYQFIGGPE